MASLETELSTVQGSLAGAESSQSEAAQLTKKLAIVSQSLVEERSIHAREVMAAD